MLLVEEGFGEAREAELVANDSFDIQLVLESLEVALDELGLAAFAQAQTELAADRNAQAFLDLEGLGCQAVDVALSQLVSLLTRRCRHEIALRSADMTR